MASTTSAALIGIDPSTSAAWDIRTAPLERTPITANSGVVAAAPAVATLPAVAGKTNFITSIELDYQGSTSAGVVAGAISGVIGGNRTFAIAVGAGASTPMQPWIVEFSPALQATSTNTAVSFTVPSLGAGNTSSQTFINGYLV